MGEWDEDFKLKNMAVDAEELQKQKDQDFLKTLICQEVPLALLYNTDNLTVEEIRKVVGSLKYRYNIDQEIEKLKQEPNPDKE